MDGISFKKKKPLRILIDNKCNLSMQCNVIIYTLNIYYNIIYAPLKLPNAYFGRIIKLGYTFSATFQSYILSGCIRF